MQRSELIRSDSSSSSSKSSSSSPSCGSLPAPNSRSFRHPRRASRLFRRQTNGLTDAQTQMEDKTETFEGLQSATLARLEPHWSPVGASSQPHWSPNRDTIELSSPLAGSLSNAPSCRSDTFAKDQYQNIGQAARHK